jgi:hypothetical protein
MIKLFHASNSKTSNCYLRIVGSTMKVWIVGSSLVKKMHLLHQENGLVVSTWGLADWGCRYGDREDVV